MRRLIRFSFLIFIFLGFGACTRVDLAVPEENVQPSTTLGSPLPAVSETLLPEATRTIAPPAPVAPTTILTDRSPALELTATATIPDLGPGRVLAATQSESHPEVFVYVCPWLEHAGDLPVFTYKIVASYPHDSQAYTQGLLYEDQVLYESTGLRGSSSVRIVDLETGEVLLSRPIPDPFFTEGITLLGGRLYQLTWQEQTGFIYDPQDFGLLGEFHYMTEGWGLTTDGTNLIMSDGSDQLHLLTPQNLTIEKSIPVTSNQVPVYRLNELEMVGDEVWANIYQTSCIARIDPASGEVQGWIDISGLLSLEEAAFAQVPNGIAFDSGTGQLLLTGKFWPRLFRVEIIPKLR